MNFDDVKDIDLYAVLKVHPQASSDEIKASYNKILLSDPENKELIDMAFKVLYNEKERKKYDDILIEKVVIMSSDEKYQVPDEEHGPFDFFKNSKKILFSDDSSFLSKVFFILAIIYVISPIDLIPDFFIPGIGYLDDVVILFISYYYGINSFKNKRR